MKTAILLSYTGLGSNLLHLSYCHQIAKKYGPITIITLSENLNQALSKDPMVREIIYLNKYYKKFTDIFSLSSFLKELKIDNIFIFYPSIRFFIASKIAKIKNIKCYPFFYKKDLHLVNTAKKFTEEVLNIKNCPTETRIFIDKTEKDIASKKIMSNKKNIILGVGSSGPTTMSLTIECTPSAPTTASATTLVPSWKVRLTPEEFSSRPISFLLK